MLSLLIGSKSPVRKCLTEYISMLLDPLSSAPVRTLLKHFWAQGAERAHVCMAALTAFILGLSARIWIEIHCVFHIVAISSAALSHRRQRW